MYKRMSWLVWLPLILALTAPAAAWADAPTNAVVISNGQVALGVSANGGLNEAGTGIQYTPAGAEGLAQSCVCAGWSLLHDQAATAMSPSVESFTFTGATALSTVQETDAATGRRVQVVHDFHLAPGSTNLYEIAVTVQNLGDTPVTLSYARTLAWATGALAPAALLADAGQGTLQPTADGQGMQFSLDLPPMDAGATQAFRLYLGGGASSAEAYSGLSANGATLISQSLADAPTFVFGYAGGATQLELASNGNGNGGNGNGGNGNGGGGGGDGSGSSRRSGGGGGGGGGAGAGAGVDPTNSGPKPNDNVSHSSALTTATTLAPSTATTTETTSTEATEATPTTTPRLSDDLLLLGDANTSFASPLSAAATPELDSLSLFGSGLVGAATYALTRWRSRRHAGGNKRLDAETKDDQA